MGFCQVTSDWVVAFVLPYIINPDAANLGAKIAYIFFGLGVIISVLLFLYVPETKGLSYEDVPPLCDCAHDQLDYLFSTKTNARKFQQVIKDYRAEHPEGFETVSPVEKLVAEVSQI